MNQKLTIAVTPQQKKTIMAAVDAEARMIAGIKLGISEMSAAGKALTEIKSQLAHGQWLEWLTENMPANYPTADAWRQRAQAWMRIHKKISECKNPELLDRAQSVKELLQLAGAIPDGDNGHALPQLDTPTPTVVIGKFSRFFSAVNVTHETVSEWPEADRKNLRDTLKPAAEMYALLSQ